MKVINKVKIQHFIKIIVLYLIIFIIIIFGGCRPPSSGLFAPGLNCGWGHFFGKVLLSSVVINADIDARDAYIQVAGIIFKLFFLIAILIFSYAVYVLKKSYNSEKTYKKTKTLLNISFLISLVAFILLFLFSNSLSYT